MSDMLLVYDLTLPSSGQFVRLQQTLMYNGNIENETKRFELPIILINRLFKHYLALKTS